MNQLIEQANTFDFWYTMSDDHNKFMTMLQKEKEITKGLMSYKPEELTGLSEQARKHFIPTVEEVKELVEDIEF